MKVRVKFAKEGVMKFIGHLDIMRYFQKAVKRAGLDASFSEGFSPHMIMSFAAPLGVGITSTGEYFDLELSRTVPTAEIEKRLNSVMAEGFHVVSARQVEDGKASTALSLVAAADYSIRFRPGKGPSVEWKEKLAAFYAQPSITVLKKTKRSEKEVDIRPFIFELALTGDEIKMKLASASGNYTKPELVLDTFLQWLGEETKPFAYQIRRLEVYAEKECGNGTCFVPLEALGENVE